MGPVVARRVVGSLAAIFGASILAFVIMRVLPGDPARLILGPLAPPGAVRSIRHQLGLDQPIYVQYWRYITDFFKGNWGYSYSDGESVRQLIGDRAPATIELALFSFAITMTRGGRARAAVHLPPPTGRRSHRAGHLLPGLRNATVLRGADPADHLLQHAAPPPGPGGTAGADGDPAADGDAPVHGGRPAGRAVRDVLASVRAPDPSRHRARARRVLVPRPPAAGEPARGLTRAVPHRRPWQGAASLARLPPSCTAERLPADADRGRPDTRRVPRRAAC